jgi:hypothetical protein
MKNAIAFILGILVGAFLAFDAEAQVAPTAARITWTNATQDVNGAQLPATGPGALTQTRIQRSFGASCETNFGTAAQTLNVTPDVLSVLFENLEPGRHCFRARHVSRDAANVEQLSDWTATVSKVIASPIGRARPPVITIE